MHYLQEAVVLNELYDPSWSQFILSHLSVSPSAPAPIPPIPLPLSERTTDQTFKMADDGPPLPTRGPSLKPQATTLDRKEAKGKLFGGKKEKRECLCGYWEWMRRDNVPL